MERQVMQMQKDRMMTHLMKKAGINPTAQREIICNILIQNADQHFTAKDIERMGDDLGMPISLSTIYRTLVLLEKRGIIIKHNFHENDSAIYEYAHKDVHHHLICKSCGKVIEITGLEPCDLHERLLHEGFHYTSYNLKIYGYCDACKPQK